MQNEEIRDLQWKLAHSQLHNVIYRDTLKTLPGGLEAFKQRYKACKEGKIPIVCFDCEKDNLLHELAVSRQSSPVFCGETSKVITNVSALHYKLNWTKY